MHSKTSINTETKTMVNEKIPLWIEVWKNKAWNRFNTMNWPSPQQEEYRRTDLSHIDFNKYKNAKQSYTASYKTPKNGTDFEVIVQFGLAPSMSTFETQPRLSAVQIFDVPKMDATNIKKLTRVIDKQLNTADNRFEMWNYTNFDATTFLRIPPNIILDKPILIDFAVDENTRLFLPKIFIILEENSSATFIFHFRNTANRDLLTNAVSNFICSPGSQGKLIHFQDSSFGTIFIDHSYAGVAKDALFERIEINTGASLVKTRCTTTLDGQGSQAILKGLSLAHKSQHFDIGTVQKHNGIASSSKCLYKNAVLDSSRTIHQGLIQVDNRAQKTDAYLTSKNMILSNNARADSIPSLKINANDVRCSHGSTSGPVDKDQLFYLVSRGLPESIAKQMLVEAYFEEILKEIPEEYSSQIRSILLNKQP